MDEALTWPRVEDVPVADLRAAPVRASTCSVDLASMRDSHYQNNEFVILNCVDDSVVADSNPPKSFVAD